jgi:hypothetical protein
MSLETELKKHINRLVFPLKEGKELELSLKAKLTKKEFKLLKALANNSIDELKTTLNLDEDSYKILFNKLVKKVNQERVKQTICKKD